MEWNNNIAVVDNTVDNNMLPKICYINVCQSKGYNELLGYSILYKQQIKDIKSMTFRDNKLKRGKYNLSTRINNLKLVCEQDNYITIANNESP